MSLTGDVNTLALSDLVQVSAMNQRTCQIHVIAPHAEGDLFLDHGSVVHAWWGDLVGAEAVYAMLTTPDVGFHVRTDVAVDAQTIAVDWQQLVLEAARRQDHGSVVQPTTRSSERWQRATPAEPVAPRRGGPSRLLWLVAAALFAASIGGLAGRLLRARLAPAAAGVLATSAPQPPLAPSLVVDASDLKGPGDALPALVDGAPPTPPRSEWTVAPTIVCRLTIGADGSVKQSRIYRSRLDLAAFEDAALAAVERYRFRPARLAGAPVAVTINWPVSFVAASGRVVRTVRIKGSDTIGGALGPALVRAFHERAPDVDVTVEALGSKTAFVGLFDGSADLGAASRPVNADELKQAARLGITLRELVIAYDGIAVIVHPSNPVRALTLDEIAQIFTGRITNWKAVGGADAPISVVSRPSYSGTHAFFRDKVLRHGDAHRTDDFVPSARVIEENRALLDAVGRDDHAIAFVGHGWLAPSVRALEIASEHGGRGVLPEVATIRDGSYPIYRPLMFYTRGAPGRDAERFLSFALGAEGQALVREHGFVPIDVPSTGVVAADDGAAGAPLEPVRIIFNTGAAHIDDAARERLAALARDRDGAKLLVVGHSDAEGAPAANHRLALARAEHVAAMLGELGVASNAISVEADDADAPLATNGSAAGRHLNRRVDVFRLAR